jgi:hypothetical protein
MPQRADRPAEAVARCRIAAGPAKRFHIPRAQSFLGHLSIKLIGIELVHQLPAHSPFGPRRVHGGGYRLFLR